MILLQEKKSFIIVCTFYNFLDCNKSFTYDTIDAQLLSIGTLDMTLGMIRYTPPAKNSYLFLH